MTADTIKLLRESNNLTQTQLAKKLGITRSSVNAWEMGLSVPSTQYIIDLAKYFKVSTDFILGVKTTSTISLVDLTETDIDILYQLANNLRDKNASMN